MLYEYLTPVYFAKFRFLLISIFYDIGILCRFEGLGRLRFVAGILVLFDDFGRFRTFEFVRHFRFVSRFRFVSFCFRFQSRSILFFFAITGFLCRFYSTVYFHWGQSILSTLTISDFFSKSVSFIDFLYFGRIFQVFPPYLVKYPLSKCLIAAKYQNMLEKFLEALSTQR